MKRNVLLHQILSEIPPEVDQFTLRYAELTILITDILDEKGWTQKELAEKMGKKPSEISKWLRGEHNFTLRSLTKLEVELGEELFHIPVKSAARAARTLANGAFANSVIVYRTTELQRHQVSFSTVRPSNKNAEAAIAA